MSCDQLRREITILRNDLSFANQRAEAAEAQLAALQAAGEWRPVSETPLEDGRYLVWWWSDEWFIAQYSTAMNTWLYDDDDDPMNPTPTYWQPLPTPPEGAQ